MTSDCTCQRIGDGAHVFRIRWAFLKFRRLARLEGMHALYIAARSVWKCRRCGQLFAWLRIFNRDHEDILVRAPNDDWTTWDWKQLAEKAASVRGWSPRSEKRYLW